MSEKVSQKQNSVKKSPENTMPEIRFNFTPQTASLKEYPELAPVIAKNIDKRNNAKFDYDVAVVEFLKGLVSPITKMFSSWGNFALGCSLIALGVAVPATLPIFVSLGLMYGGFKSLEFIAKLIYAAATKQDGDYVEQSFKNLGEATSSLGLSALGARSALGKSKIFSAEELTKLSLLGALTKNFSVLPKTFTLSWQTLRSGEFLANFKNPFSIFKFNKKTDDPDPPFSFDMATSGPNPQGPKNITIRAMDFKPPTRVGSLTPSHTLINSGGSIRSPNGLHLQTAQLTSTGTMQTGSERPAIFLANPLQAPSPQPFTALPPKPDFISFALPLNVNLPDSKTIPEEIEITENDLGELTRIFIEELDLDPFYFEDQIIISTIREAIQNNDQEKLKQILEDFGIDDSDLEKTKSQILESFNQQKQEILKLKAERESYAFKPLDIKNSVERNDSSLTTEQIEELTQLLKEIPAKQALGLERDRSIEFAIFLLRVWEICKKPNQKFEIPSNLFPGIVYSINPYHIKDAVAFDPNLQRIAVTAVAHLLRKNNPKSDEAAKIITEFYTTAIPTYRKVDQPDFFRNHLNQTFSQKLIIKIKRLLHEPINSKLLVDNTSAADTKLINDAAVSKSAEPKAAVETKSNSLNYDGYQELAKAGNTSEIAETMVLYLSLGQNKEIKDAVNLLLKLLRDPEIDFKIKQKILRDDNLRVIAKNTIASRKIPEHLVGTICGLFNLDSTVYINYGKLEGPKIKTLARYRDRTKREFQEVVPSEGIKYIQQEIDPKGVSAQTKSATAIANKTEVVRPTKQQLRDEELRQLRKELALKGIEFSADGWKSLIRFPNNIQIEILASLAKIEGDQFNLILSGRFRNNHIHPVAETKNGFYIVHVTSDHRATLRVHRNERKLEVVAIQTKGEQETDTSKSQALKKRLK